MEFFSWKTKNGTPPTKEQRKVYFTCHPADFDRCFEKLTADIHKTHDCAIFYTADMTAPIPDAYIEAGLEQMNLFIVPVTLRLLTEPNRAMDEDLACAKKAGATILPFMREAGIDDFYKKPEAFGERQYLSPYSSDLTELRYEDKLKKFLDSVLISDEMVKRIQAAFDAYIFLSYRKKDRLYANKLMRMIHKIPECRDIAIWYDEFLTPSESFSDNIQKMLQRSELFTLLVTPSILENQADGTPNYIIRKEYPAARTSEKVILPAEMVPTDKDALADKFENLPRCINPADEIAFRDLLLTNLKKLAIAENNDIPEHNFLIGLAYLEGIDMEVDRERGISLITSAAEANQLEAMRKLYDMYSQGYCVPLNYKKALHWALRIVDYYENGENILNTINAMNNVSMLYLSLEDYGNALVWSQKAYDLSLATVGPILPPTVEIANTLSAAYSGTGQHEKALQIQADVYERYCSVWGREHHDPYIPTLLGNLANKYWALGNYQRALEIEEEVYELCRNELGETHTDTLLSLHNLACTYHSVGEVTKSMELHQKTYALLRETVGEDHPQTWDSLSAIGITYGELPEPNYQRALSTLQKVYDANCRILGQTHPKTLRSLREIAVCYNKLEQPAEAMSAAMLAYNFLRKIQGEDHEDTLDAQTTISQIYYSAGMYKESLVSCEQIYEKRLKLQGAQHPDTVTAMINLSLDLLYLRRYDRAFALASAAYEQRRSTFGLAHPQTLSALDTLVAVCIKQKNQKKRTQLREEAYLSACKEYGETHTASMKLLSKLISACIDSGDRPKALSYAKKEYALLREHAGETHSDTLNALYQIAALYHIMGVLEKSVSTLRKWCTLHQIAYGPAHEKTSYAMACLSNIDSQLQIFRKAFARSEKIIAGQSKLLKQTHPHIISSLSKLAQGYNKLGDHQKAAEIYGKAYGLLCKKFGPDHPRSIQAKASHAAALLAAAEDSES